MHRRSSYVFLGALLAALLITASCSSGTEPGPLARAYASLRSRFSSGQGELQKALDAKKAAHSWRTVTLLRAHPGRALQTTIEVSCPDREHIVTSLGEAHYESIRVGNQAWTRSNNGPWTAQPEQPEAYPCGGNPGAPAPWAMMNEGRDPATVLATMAGKMNAQVARGNVVKVGESSCQQWVVSFQHPGSGPGVNYTVCIDPGSHLPQQVVMGSGGLVTTYSDWDKPMQIDPPPSTTVQAGKAAPGH